jgi:hypothetical protein
MRNVFALSIASVSLATSVAALAEPETPPPAATTLAATAGPTTLEKPAGEANGVQVTAGTDSSSATIKITPVTNLPMWVFSDISLALSTPIAKGTPNTNIATLDGLANGTTLAVSLSKVSYRAKPPPSTTWRRQFCSDLINTIRSQLHEDPTANPAKPDPKKIDPDNCAESNIGYVAANGKTLAPLEQGRLAREWNGYYFHGPIQTYGLTGKVGYQQFTYNLPPSLTPMKDAHDPWSIGPYYGIQFNNPGIGLSNPLLLFSYQYQDTFADNTTKTICPTTSSTPVLTCVTNPIGLPKETIKSIVAVEVRDRIWLAANSLLSSFAFDLGTYYDTKAKVWGVDLPIYLVGDKTGLSGGVQLGWRSDTNGFTASVFVSKAFDIFGAPSP